VVDARFEAAARRLGLLEPGGVERLIAETGGAGGRGRTARPRLGDAGRLLLRPVLHGGLLGPLLGASLVGMRRPLAELEATAALRAAGAPVPVPVLAVGRRVAGPIWNAAVGTLAEEGAEDAQRFLERNPGREAVLDAAAATGDAVRRFHDAGGRHADLHLGNLLLRQREGALEALVIDLDKARRLSRVPAARRMAELMRLYRSAVKRGLLERIGARGCARFLGAYVRGDRALRRALLAHLPRERTRLRLHALRWQRD
jgi:tRNA A-37 threonylcarbamoyl transferase component Bud32